MDRGPIPYSHCPRVGIKPEAVVITVLHQRVPIIATTVMFERKPAHISPLTTDIDEDAPISVVQEALSVVQYAKFMQPYLERSYVVCSCRGPRIPAKQDSLSEHVGGGPGERDDDPESGRLRRGRRAARFQLGRGRCV